MITLIDIIIVTFVTYIIYRFLNIAFKVQYRAQNKSIKQSKIFSNLPRQKEHDQFYHNLHQIDGCLYNLNNRIYRRIEVFEGEHRILNKKSDSFTVNISNLIITDNKDIWRIMEFGNPIIECDKVQRQLLFHILGKTPQIIKFKDLKKNIYIAFELPTGVTCNFEKISSLYFLQFNTFCSEFRVYYSIENDNKEVHKLEFVHKNRSLVKLMHQQD